MVHRDIKPSNLLVADGVVKILDMGLARLDRPEDVAMHTLLTQDGLVLGTPDFIAPEQARNAHTIDIRADLYSLGCTLYYLLTGQVPFNGSTFTEKVIQHQLDEAPRVEELRPDVSRALGTVVRKLMAKNPDDRYRTPEELAAILESVPLTQPSAGAVSAQVVPETVPVEVRRAGMGSGRRKVLSKVVRRPVVKQEPICKGPKTPTVPIVVAEQEAVPRPLRPARKRLRVVPVVLALVILFACGAAMRGLLSGAESATPTAPPSAPPPNKPPPPPAESAVEKAWKALVARTYDRQLNMDALRREILHFRMTYPGTNQAHLALDLLTRLPSALEKLDAARLKIRYAWMPRELVAAFGRRPPEAGKRLRAVAFSPDCRHVAAGGFDDLLRIWDPAESLWPNWAREHDGPIQCAAYAPDGQTLATGGEDGKVILWDAAHCTELRTLRGHENVVMAVAFAPDGRALASGSGGGTVRLWDISGKERCALKTLAARVLSLTFSPDGTRLIAGRSDGIVQVWDVSRPKPLSLASFKAHSTWVWVTALSPDGKTLVTGGGGDGTLRLCSWDGHRITERVLLQGHEDIVHNAVFTPDGRTLISAGQDRRVIFWDLATCKKIKEWELRSQIFGLAITIDGRHLATANGNGTVFILRLPAPQRGKLDRK
jgi:WD40 repeat protein